MQTLVFWSKVTHWYVWHKVFSVVCPWKIQTVLRPVLWIPLSIGIAPPQRSLLHWNLQCASSMRHNIYWPMHTVTVPCKECPWHDYVIKWKHFPRYWPFVRGIHRSAVNSPHKGQWCRALMLSLICAWIDGWLNNREAGDLRRNHAHYDVTVMAYNFGIYSHHWICISSSLLCQ